MSTPAEDANLKQRENEYLAWLDNGFSLESAAKKRAEEDEQLKQSQFISMCAYPGGLYGLFYWMRR